jgi:hypothetical protein
VRRCAVYHRRNGRPLPPSGYKQGRCAPVTPEGSCRGSRGIIVPSGVEAGQRVRDRFAGELPTLGR